MKKFSTEMPGQQAGDSLHNNVAGFPGFERGFLDYRIKIKRRTKTEVQSAGCLEDPDRINLPQAPG
jgi:hypothetical protein